MNTKMRKHIDDFKNFKIKPEINESVKNTMVGKIFTSDYDVTLDKLFLDIKNNFNNDNLSDKEVNISGLVHTIIEYKMDNGDILSARDDTFFAIPGYTIEINEEDIDCSFLLSKKIYKFLKKQRDLKYKEKDLNKINKEKEIKSKEIKSDKQKKLDKLSRFKSKYK